MVVPTHSIILVCMPNTHGSLSKAVRFFILWQKAKKEGNENEEVTRNRTGTGNGAVHGRM